MFFFASDNRLAPLLVSELKAIKDAGFQEHTEVLVYYDPLEKGCPTKIYNVNNKRKADALAEWEQGRRVRKSVIGDGNDSYVRKMDGDEVDPKTFSPEMQKAMANSSKALAHKMLGYFLDYVLGNHKARNYILFLIGHGMIVGSDVFLPDDDPVSAVTMKQLKEIMSKFVQGGKTSLQLLALHSCSMSSMEVAYQLRGTANYMLAHQGPAFVNSWNYRQVLKKILNTINKEKRDAGANARTREERERLVNDKQIDVKTLVDKLYYHSLYNATDFLSAGYSADLALYSLEEDKLARIKEPIQLLVRELKANLDEENSLVKDLILLAHWESQSFWEENYTDLYDFCLCLSRRCNDAMRLYAKLDELVNKLGRVKEACDGLIDVLRIINSDDLAERFRGLVIHAGNFGTKYQYAHGLSVYFPWCEPLDDEPRESELQNVASPPEPEATNQTVLDCYKSYDFNTDLGVDSWSSFLELYFKKTKRKSRWDEEHEESGAPFGETNFTDDHRHLLGEAVSEFNVDGSLGTRTPEVGHRTPETGGLDCDCPTIKNYPTVIKTYTPVSQNFPTTVKKVLTRRVKQFSITPDALRAFQQEPLDVTEDDDTDG
ncbi:MAG: hypothetical protein V7638_4411 [Acidobacteriota bacterium]